MSTHYLDSDLAYKQSTWTPPKGRDPWLDMYMAEIKREIISQANKKSSKNLSKDEEQALLNLVEDESIIIRPADKGSGIVIIDADDYKERLLQEVHSSSICSRTSGDETRSIQAKVKNMTKNCLVTGS